MNLDCEVVQGKPLNAQLAGDLSKMTGSAKIALAGSGVTTVGVAMLPIVPWGTVVGGIVAGAGALIGVAGKLWGNKFHQSTGVRWLLQKYEYFVMGNAGATSSNTVTEEVLQDAYNWFTAVLGIPIYDKYRYHALCGEDPNTGKLLVPNQSYSQRAAAYMMFPEASGVSYENALLAAQLADQFDESAQPGGWASLLIAPKYFNDFDCDSAHASTEDNFNELLNPAAKDSPILSMFTGLGAKLSFLPVLLGAVGLYLLFFMRSKKKK